MTATIRLFEVTLGFNVAFGIFGENRDQRVFQVVMHRQKLVRAGTAARTQGHAGFQIARPFFPLGGAKTIFAGVSEFEQGEAIVAGQHHHGLTQWLLIDFDPYRQRYIKEMLLEIRRQTLGLRQQTAWCGAGGVGSHSCAGTKQQRKRSRDGCHREHERVLG
ncbi:hypothetical protein D3C81_1089210 [compost metagenome]